MAYNENPSYSQTLIKISSQTVSGAASVAITSAITSKYSSYVVKIRNLQSDYDGSDLYMNWSINNGSSYVGSGYFWSDLVSENGNISSAQNTNDVQFPFFDASVLRSNSGQAGANMNADVYFYNLNQASLMPSFQSTFSYQGFRSWNVFVSGGFETPQAVNAISFILQDGNISGTFTIYGVIEP